MDNHFDHNEHLLRAVFPRFYYRNGSLSSAAFKDSLGLSVTRQYNRPLQQAVNQMVLSFSGNIVSVVVEDCLSVNAYLVYCPSKSNKYHCEIHGGKGQVVLSSEQAKYLANKAQLVYCCTIAYS